MFLLTKHFTANKIKGRISRWVFQENKGRQIFRKINVTYPLIRTFLMCMCLCGSKKCFRGKKCSFFGKFGVLCFEIRPFTLFMIVSSRFYQMFIISFLEIFNVIYSSKRSSCLRSWFTHFKPLFLFYTPKNITKLFFVVPQKVLRMS